MGFVLYLFTSESADVNTTHNFVLAVASCAALYSTY
jgi:hypothetical protein